jgi:hypothetical protein
VTAEKRNDEHGRSIVGHGVGHGLRCWSRRCAVVGLAALALTLLSFPAAARQPGPALEMYTLEGPADKIAEAAHGLELAALRRTASGIRADAVLTKGQRAKLVTSGVAVTLKRNQKSVTQQAAAQALGGYNVWRSWDEPGGIRDELFDVARWNPQIVKLVVLGRSHQGRPVQVAERGADGTAATTGTPRCDRSVWTDPGQDRSIP